MRDIEGTVTRLVLEYAQADVSAPLDPRLTLRDDLALESLALVSLAVRLGDELGRDVTDEATTLARLETVGDLFALARRLEAPHGAT